MPFSIIFRQRLQPWAHFAAAESDVNGSADFAAVALLLLACFVAAARYYLGCLISLKFRSPAF